MRAFLRKAGRLLIVFYGVIFALAALGGIISAFTEHKLINLLLAMVMAGVSFLLLRRRRKKELPPDQGKSMCTAGVAVSPVAVKTAEPIDAYITVGNVTYRTDGQPISDREVPYLIERGFQEQLDKPAGVPPDATPEEYAFLSALEAALDAAHKSPCYFTTRMSTKALSVTSSRQFYMGKIKLQGRKTWMQYMRNLYDAEVVENVPLEEYIRLIKYWVKSA